MSTGPSRANCFLSTSTPSSKNLIPANSGRKRANAISPSLYRPLPSPSRAAKMVDVWHNAAVSLERSNIATTPRPLHRTLEERQDFALSQWSGRYGPGGDDTRDMLSFSGDYDSGTIATPLEIRHGQVFPTPEQYPITSNEDQSLQISTPETAGSRAWTYEQIHQDAVQYPVIDTASIQGEREPLMQTEFSHSEHRSPLQTFMTGPLTQNEMDDDNECHSSHGIPLIMPFADSNALLQPRCQTDQIDIWIDDVMSQTEHHPALLLSPAQLAPPLNGVETTKPSLPPKARPLPKIPASPPFTTPAKRGTNFFPKKTSKQDVLKSPLRAISGTSSNKENMSPSTTPSPTKIPLPASAAPPARRMPGVSFAASPLGAHDDSPATRIRPTYVGQENVVPTPQHPGSSPDKQCGSPSVKTPNARRLIHTMMAVCKSPKSKKPPQTPQSSDLHSNNDKGDVLKELSPLVEVQRKGKRAGIKRERCASYWDEDILREIG